MSVIAFWPSIQAHASSRGLAIDPYLLAAIVQVESEGNPFAARYEAGYKYISKAATHAATNHTSLNTEVELQKFSLGLCQMMGGVFRELGLTGPLPQAFDPEINLAYGAKKIAILNAKYSVLEDVISSYNGGTPRKVSGGYENQKYVDAVTAAMTSIKAKLPLAHKEIQL